MCYKREEDAALRWFWSRHHDFCNTLIIIDDKSKLLNPNGIERGASQVHTRNIDMEATHLAASSGEVSSIEVNVSNHTAT